MFNQYLCVLFINMIITTSWNANLMLNAKQRES